MQYVISHAPTKIQFPTRQDGGPRDPDPRRRAARLDDHGIAIRKAGVLRHDVVRGDQHLGSRRTRGGAELLAHTIVDPRSARRRQSAPSETVAGWHLRTR